MKKEELVSLYDRLNTGEKWELIKNAMMQDIKEICPMSSIEFLRYAKEQKEEAIRNKKYFKLIWHYWIRRMPLIGLWLGRKYLPPKNKEYYQYRTWYYEYLEPVIDIRDNFSKHEKVFEFLADDKSKDIYCDILMARITKNDKYYLMGYEKSKDYQQYFALDILPSPNPEGIFVDCGGYIGDTAEKFIKYYSKEYKLIYVYEPDFQNVFRAKENLRDYHNICVRQCGVGRENGMVSFNSTGTSSSSVQQKGRGRAQIKVISLDTDIEKPVTFIKMDIEGEESNAIAGAEKHIKYEKPICAICLYHKIQDIWKLPLQIMNINPGYKLYLRHYTESFLETVAYFV